MRFMATFLATLALHQMAALGNPGPEFGLFWPSPPPPLQTTVVVDCQNTLHHIAHWNMMKVRQSEARGIKLERGIVRKSAEAWIVVALGARAPAPWKHGIGANRAFENIWVMAVEGSGLCWSLESHNVSWRPAEQELRDQEWHPRGDATHDPGRPPGVQNRGPGRRGCGEVGYIAVFTPLFVNRNLNPYKWALLCQIYVFFITRINKYTIYSRLYF